jgi:hypothetical protein
MTTKYQPHDRMKERLISQGLLDDRGAITKAGREYIRALIARCQQHYVTSDGEKDQYLKKVTP